MSSRTPLTLGLLGLVALVATCWWVVQSQSKPAPPTPAPAAVKAEPATAVPGSPELADSEKIERTEPASASPAPASAGQHRADAAPRGKNQPAVVVNPALLQPVSPLLSTAATDPPKLPTLGPILGGAGAIKGRYFGSTYAERQERADLLEAALNYGEPQDKDHMASYQALKDELIWLRENMGTPPVESPK